MSAARPAFDGSGRAILADPEGNEFCVLRGESDRAPDLGVPRKGGAVDAEDLLGTQWQ
ncbi:hypothetical protein SAMN05444920_10920 [Nonomuraea solani]|uniref:Glyoxalase-like domain-containing protein n=1 Tax=Nonomuraea solani TaxID=1144553 RepID=A0A1H6EEP9_9ACTN|nr:hypothetical protein SAMN05444920_10920 [Nonomuraea solani]